MTDVDDETPKSRGWRRAKELQKEAEIEFAELRTALVGCLGREPSAVDIVAIEALTSATISARRQRARGKPDREDLRLVAQLLRATGLKPPPPTAAAPPTIQQLLAQRGYAPPQASPTIDPDDDGGDE
jgi:hypothetical protein